MYNGFLLTDFYKTTHLLQFRPEITHLTSYLVPRGSRLNKADKMVWFGLKGFIDKYLVNEFDENFFERPWEDIADEISYVLSNGLSYTTKRIEETLTQVKALHTLGYLPIEINALPEGTLVPMGIPACEIRTTHNDFAWVGQAIESLLSCSIWHPSVSATIGREYLKIAKAAYDKTVVNAKAQLGMCDFSMRGQESYESAVASSAGWLASFYNSSTVEGRRYVEEHYSDEEVIIKGLTSTEHSVMTSDYAITGSEKETYRRLLTEVYPDVSFAAVCDSYDFWNVLTKILPELREEIEAHEGFLGVRHDSSDPVYALCGLPVVNLNELCDSDMNTISDIEDFKELVYEWVNEDDHMFPRDTIDVRPKRVIFMWTEYRGEDRDPIEYKGVFEITPEWGCERGFYTDRDYTFLEKYNVHLESEGISYEDKGMVETMYEIFGGSVNGKGYKVINPKLKAVYGDSITLPRAKEIYDRLEAKGFAANNVSLGVGSFSMQCIEEGGGLKPFTRDTFSIAIKATYGRVRTPDGEEEIVIYKDPKGFAQKASLKGLCVPYDKDGTIVVEENLREPGRAMFTGVSLFENFFKNGKVEAKSFNDIRERIKQSI